MLPGPVTVTIPATSANLGPGFDSFGLALELRNRFSARLANEWSVRVTGLGEGVLAEGPDNPVARAMAAVFAHVGFPATGAEIECENHIPAGEGVGSSASAIVGGMLLADRLCGGGLGEKGILELAAAMEGHPDNVAAALMGGFTIAWASDDGAARARRIEPGRGLAAVLVAADRPLLTEQAREMLPDRVPHADAAFNSARAGLLVAGVLLGDEAALAEGLADRIHEPYRWRAIPDASEVRRVLLEAGAAGVVVSGAGPTMLALVAGEDDETALRRASRLADRAAEGIDALEGRKPPRALALSREGARFE